MSRTRARRSSGRRFDPNGSTAITERSLIRTAFQKAHAELERELQTGQVKQLVIDGKATCPEGEALLTARNSQMRRGRSE